MNNTKIYWDSFCNSLAMSKEVTDSLFKKITLQYASPIRYYHTLDGHITACIREFTALRDLAKNPIVVEAALWMHDAFYEKENRTNEVDSARWATKFFKQANVILNFEQLERLIMMTKNHHPGNDADAQIVSDCDLAILGNSKLQFDAYESNIRKEYLWVPEAIYRKKRAELLNEFLARPKIYRTELFYKKYEKRARVNLKRSIARLIYDKPLT